MALIRKTASKSRTVAMKKKLRNSSGSSAITPSTPIVKQNTPIGTAQVTAGALNVRSGPGAEYPRIGGLSQGRTIEVYADEGDWLKIAYGTGFGYVSQKYTTFEDKTVEPSPQPPEQPTPEPEPTPEPDPGPESADSTAPAGATYTGTETLRKGSSNKEAVKTLQLYLNKYLASMGVSAMSVDSSFGNMTWKYLMYYQYSRNLCDSSGKIEVDGVCGPKTWNAIRSGAPIVYDIREPIAFQRGLKLEANCTQKLSCGGAMCPTGAAWFEKMIAAAKKDGQTVKTTSTFRAMTDMGTTNAIGTSKNGQIELYIHHGGNTEMASQPGYSNHQSGRAIDFANTSTQSTPMFKWLSANAASYKFENYKKEPWHWNYIGS